MVENDYQKACVFYTKLWYFIWDVHNVRRKCLKEDYYAW